MKKFQLSMRSSWRQLILILFLCLGMNEIGNAQFLSGILPQYGAVVHQSTTTLSWNLLPGATSYNVTIAQDELFTQNVQSSGPITNTNWTVSSLVLGSWFWKVEGTTLMGTVAGEMEMFTRFDPSTQASLSLWLKADAGIVLDASNKIESWTDQSPSALQFTQITASKRPELTASSFGGFPSLSFTGGTKFLSGGDVLDLGLNSRSFYVIGKMAATNQTFFSKTLAAQAATRYGMIKDGASTAFICQTDAVTQNHVYSSTNTPNFALYNAQINRASAQVRFLLNGILLGTNITNANYNWNSTYRFLIGAYNNATDNGELLPLNGNISEMIFVDTDDANERMKTENYIKFKYHSFNAGVDIYKTDYCSASISLPAGFTNIEWSNGATSQTISVTESALLTVQATDPLGFLWQDTILVTYPTIPSPVNTAICVGQSNVWNADMGPGFTYLWSSGATTPTLSITSPGSYSVQVTDGLGCIKNSETLNFTIDNYAQTAYLGNDTSLCVGNLIALQVGAAETVNYDWNGTSTVAQPPFWIADTTGNYFVETTNINGCTARDTIHITISGQAPIANFSFQNQCFGLPNAFTDLSVGLPTDAVVLWNWDLGDGNSNTTQNPAYTYGSAGTYTVQLYVESAGGCGAFYTEVLTVHAVPIASFTKVGNCSGQSVQFTNTTTVGDAPVTAYLWNFDQPWTGAANTSTVPTPFRTFDAAGTYDVSLQVTDTNGCVNDTIIPLVIDQSPVIAFTAPDACANAPISFTNSSVVETPATYLWDFGDLTSSILPLPVKYFSNTGIHTITLTATAGNGCVNTLQQQMYVNPNPIAGMTFGPMCMGTYTSLMDNSTVVSGSIASYLWVINSTDSLTGSTNNYVFNSLGQQQVVHQVTSDMGCTSTANQFVDVAEELAASFTASSSIIAAGEPITFTNTTPTLSIVSWDFGDGNSLNFVSPTTYQYGSNYIDSTVTVSMFVSNVLGCMDTATMTVSIQPMDLDLSLSNLYVQDINGFYTIGIELKNEGSITITKANLKVLLPDGPVAFEEWNGNLIPGASVIYIFNSSIDAYIPSSNNEEAFLCATGVGFDMNNIAEVFLDNNKVCKNLVGEAVVLLPIYPNPASNQVTIEMLITQDADVSLELLDARGRLIKTILPTQSLASGLYTYDVDISQIQAGTYFVRMRNGDVDVVNKLIISNY